jgi:UDP-N-acetylmuramoyl-tripeptide--D-alanyl-D-alanine ligase
MFKVNEILKATKGKLTSKKKGALIKGISTDSRTIRPKEAFIAIKGPNFDGHNFIDEAIKRGAGCVIYQSSVISHQLSDVVFIKVKDTIKALGDIARFQREKFNIPIIAVTGSNGKTTTKEMIAWVLTKKFKVLKNEGTKNNHIGLPLTLLDLNDTFDFAVLELGTNHSGEIEYLAKICLPNIGVITNIGHSHLEHLKSLEGVFKEKCTLIKHLKSPHLTVLNADDNLSKKELLKKNKPPITFSIGVENKSDFFASDIKNHAENIEFLVNQKNKFTLRTLGRFNIYNALCAALIARIFGMEYKDIVGALAAFEFPKSRLKLFKLKNLKFIDDTYNSNPFSLKHALEVLDNFNTKGRKIFVMGDMLELGDNKELFHYEVGKNAAKICDIFISVGKLSKWTAEAMRLSDFDLGNIFTCENSIQARQILSNKINPSQDDIILVKGSRAMKMEEVFEI